LKKRTAKQKSKGSGPERGREPARPRETSQRRVEPDASNAEAKQRLWAVLAVAWLFSYGFYFYSLTLPNSHPSVSRLAVWLELPDILLANLSSSSSGVPSGWSFFPQRLDLLLVAGFILVSAWAWGQVALRTLRPAGLTRLERTVFAFGLGLSSLSLVTLGLGLSGWLHRWLFLLVLSSGVAAELACRLRERADEGSDGTKRARVRGGPSEESSSPDGSDQESPSRAVRAALVGTAALFLLAMLLGAMLPPTDFDVKEYHLQGPKEFFLLGRVTFLPHNVYTSFPFLTEMLSLLAMVLRNDWFRGALAGKVVLMSFAPLTALAVLAAGRRWFEPWVGWLGAFVYLTTPWTYRLSIIAYVEGGLTFFLFASVLAAGLALEQQRRGRVWTRTAVLCGLLAGSAMACKYTGAVQVVGPLGAAVCGAAGWWSKPTERWKSVATAAGCFALGVAVTVGPWLVKNWLETGNPVYPLLYTVFDGRDWDAALNARWRHAHSPHTFALSDLGRKFVDVTARSDWLSPLLFSLAPLALLVDGADGRRRAAWLWAYVAYLFATWWLLTHRIDRFWVPLVPVAALLAGAGLRWRKVRPWQVGASVFVTSAVLFNLAFITTPLCGFNLYLADLRAARDIAETTEMGVRFLNRLNLPPNARVLCVGAAQVFDARFDLVYNTVFDYSVFQQWCADPNAPKGTPEADWPMRPADEIRQIFRANGITHLYVNWREILRYRPTYGYTDFVKPERFDWLRRHGVLGSPLSMPEGFGDPESLSRDERHELETWGKKLLTTLNGRQAFVAAQVFPVVDRQAEPLENN